MVQKFFYLFVIYSLCFEQTKAQQENDINKLLESVSNNVKSVLNDTSLDVNCKKSLEPFVADFPRMSATDMNEKYLNEVLIKCRKLIALPKDSLLLIACNTNNRKNLVAAVNKLVSRINNAIVLLKKKPANTSEPVIKKPVQVPPATVIANTPGKTPPEMAPVIIKLIDSVTNKIVNGNVVVDSMSISIKRIKETGNGMFVVLLSPGLKYTIAVSEKNYDLYKREYVNTGNTTDSLIIKLQTKEPGKIVETVKTVSNANLIEPRVNSLANTNKALIISVTVLFFLVVIMALMYIRTLKHLKSVKKVSMSPLKKQADEHEMNANPENVNVESSVLPEVKMEPAELAAIDPMKIETKEAEIPIDRKEIETIQGTEEILLASQSIKEPATIADEREKEENNVFKSGRYFLCELMMTAGPRKNHVEGVSNDRDMGEDVCGFVANADEVFIWLLDGTSDSNVLKNSVDEREYFSSRLLALSIADQLRKYFIEQPAMPLSEMILPALRAVKTYWLQHIENLPSEEKLILKNFINTQGAPDCSTTLLFARLSLNGDFASYRTGDSKMFLFDRAPGNNILFIETPFVTINDDSNDRIFFRLTVDDQGKFDILFNKPLYETLEKENINTIITFSDGIGSFTQQILRDEYSSKPNDVLKEVMYQLQKTGDDKTICFIEIKESQKS